MDAIDKRRLNIKYLADVKYGRIALAEKLGYQDANYINQLCGGFGAFGNRTARKIEKTLDLPHGWMDTLHSDLYKAELLSEPQELTAAQQRLITAYQELPVELRKAVLRLCDIPDSEA